MKKFIFALSALVACNSIDLNAVSTRIYRIAVGAPLAAAAALTIGAITAPFWAFSKHEGKILQKSCQKNDIQSNALLMAASATGAAGIGAYLWTVLKPRLPQNRVAHVKERLSFLKVNNDLLTKSPTGSALDRTIKAEASIGSEFPYLDATHGLEYSQDALEELHDTLNHAISDIDTSSQQEQAILDEAKNLQQDIRTLKENGHNTISRIKNTKSYNDETARNASIRAHNRRKQMEYDLAYKRLQNEQRAQEQKEKTSRSITRSITQGVSSLFGLNNHKCHHHRCIKHCIH